MRVFQVRTEVQCGSALAARLLPRVCDSQAPSAHVRQPAQARQGNLGSRLLVVWNDEAHRYEWVEELRIDKRRNEGHG